METEIPYNQIAASFNGIISNGDRQILDAWLNNNSQNKELYFKLEKIWNESGRLATEFSPNAKNALNKVHSRIGVQKIAPNRSISMFKRTLLMAAGVAFLVGISYLISHSKTETILISSTSNNQQKEIVIADGTKIVLNRNSSISYPSEFNGKQRKVKLEGEAYFEVAKDSTKPFSIEANGTTTTVLGTKFNLKAYTSEDSVIISLTEGKVCFSEVNSNQKVILIPGEKAMYIKSKKSLYKLKIEDPNFISWKTHIMEFSNTPLQIVSKTMSKYFGKSIEIGDTTLATLRFTGTFKDSKMHEMLQTIEEALNLKAVEDSNKIVLTNK